MQPDNDRHVVIGAGPAGLMMASELAALKKRVLVLEADPDYVGGLARTVQYNGFRFDIGGHRFYTKSEEINRIWREMLPNDFIEVPRLSRIYYKNRFFPYPIELLATLRNLGFISALQIGMSYLRSRCFPRQPEASFEDWIVNRFGYQLFTTFFKTYTEKVWGIPCTQISKDFAAQRIRGLSLLQLLKHAVFPPRQDGSVKSLIKTFTYPRLGPGQLWEAVRDRLLAEGQEILHGKTVVALKHDNGVMTSVVAQDGSEYGGSHFYPTLPLSEFVKSLVPPPPSQVINAGLALRYRDFLTVAVVIDNPAIFPDNWIYIHDPEVHVGRIQNYKNWSREMVADLSKTCLGMEYFCNRGDPLWEMDDASLIRLAAQELEKIGLTKVASCIDGCVVRMINAYPVYDNTYRQHKETIKTWLNAYFTNVFPAGRGGLHNYNSQDHAMLTGILSVRNMNEKGRIDVWNVNTEEEFAEEHSVSKGTDARLTPRLVSEPVATETA